MADIVYYVNSDNRFKNKDYHQSVYEIDYSKLKKHCEIYKGHNLICLCVANNLKTLSEMLCVFETNSETSLKLGVNIHVIYYIDESELTKDHRDKITYYLKDGVRIYEPPAGVNFPEEVRMVLNLQNQFERSGICLYVLNKDIDFGGREDYAKDDIRLFEQAIIALSEKCPNYGRLRIIQMSNHDFGKFDLSKCLINHYLINGIGEDDDFKLAADYESRIRKFIQKRVNKSFENITKVNFDYFFINLKTNDIQNMFDNEFDMNQRDANKRNLDVFNREFKPRLDEFFKLNAPTDNIIDADEVNEIFRYVQTKPHQFFGSKLLKFYEELLTKIALSDIIDQLSIDTRSFNTSVRLSPSKKDLSNIKTFAEYLILNYIKGLENQNNDKITPYFDVKKEENAKIELNKLTNAIKKEKETINKDIKRANSSVKCFPEKMFVGLFNSFNHQEWNDRDKRIETLNRAFRESSRGFPRIKTFEECNSIWNTLLYIYENRYSFTTNGLTTFEEAFVEYINHQLSENKTPLLYNPVTFGNIATEFNKESSIVTVRLYHDDIVNEMSTTLQKWENKLDETSGKKPHDYIVSHTIKNRERFAAFDFLCIEKEKFASALKFIVER